MVFCGQLAVLPPARTEVRGAAGIAVDGFGSGFLKFVFAANAVLQVFS
jgi:hypothetical protein